MCQHDDDNATVDGPTWGRWRSWLSHLSNTQKVLSSNLGRLMGQVVYILIIASFSLILVNAYDKSNIRSVFRCLSWSSCHTVTVE